VERRRTPAPADQRYRKGVVYGHQYERENWGLSAQQKAIRVLELTAPDREERAAPRE